MGRGVVVRVGWGRSSHPMSKDLDRAKRQRRNPLSTGLSAGTSALLLLYHCPGSPAHKTGEDATGSIEASVPCGQWGHPLGHQPSLSLYSHNRVSSPRALCTEWMLTRGLGVLFQPSASPGRQPLPSDSRGSTGPWVRDSFSLGERPRSSSGKF